MSKGINDVEDYLKEKHEGDLFAHLYMSSWSSDRITLRRDLYAIVDGVVLEVGFGKETPSGDTVFDIVKDCKRISKYNPNKKYKRTVSKDFSYSEIKKMFKL